MALGCVEFAVPGNTLEDKLRALESHKMWLELVNDGFNKKQLNNILGILPSFNTPIKSVQAYLLHDLRMLSAKNRDRKVALSHVEETIKIASKVGAQNVVTVATYGEPTINNPMEKCIDIFRHFGKLGAELDVTISIEALSRDKTTFLPSISEVYRFVHDLGSDHVRLMADTMHIHANGENVAETIREYATEIAELHLHDTNSKPPGQGSIDFDPILKVVREKFKELICLEYRPSLDPYADFINTYEVVTKIISAVR
ncbi:MAG: sugar phosphate isomerase/epimerase [Euryarchaeota archaeon]|nr:sugar phosphate isomerase/epimerase [Euryarchaeota archaeon]